MISNTLEEAEFTRKPDSLHPVNGTSSKGSLTVTICVSARAENVSHFDFVVPKKSYSLLPFAWDTSIDSVLQQGRRPCSRSPVLFSHLFQLYRAILWDETPHPLFACFVFP